MHVAAPCVGHLAADGEGLFKILRHLRNGRAVIEIDRVFKVKIQAPEVHIDCSDDGVLVVCQADLRVDEAGLELENAHARLRQRLVVCPRHSMDVPFVRNARRDDAHVNACFCRYAERRDHLVVQNQIRRHDPEPAAGGLDEALEDRRAHVLVVQRAVCKRLQIALALRILRIVRAERGHILLQPRDIVPDAEEHHHHRPDGLAFYQNAAVLPVAEALDLVDVFIREVHAAREAHFAVDEHELAVVAVIEPAGEDGDKRVKDVRLNAHLAELFAVAHRKARDAAEVIVQNAHVHALHRLAVQNVQNGVPHLAAVDDEKFEENIVLGLFELFEHPHVAALAARKIDGLRVIIDRVTRARKKVARMVPCRNVLPLERLHDAFLLPQVLRDHDLHAVHAAVLAV